MPVPKEFARLGGLFDTASIQSKPFLKQCSKTKFLAVSDYYRASDQYIELVRETLSAKNLGQQTQETCHNCLSNIKNALEIGQLNTHFMDALEELRTMYLEDILKPALKGYIQEDTIGISVLETIYLNALKIDSLIETIQFMNKVQPRD
ncbi:hypothetical protein EU527_13420 [Candidatus Thorarchaeota archaeon]|nr:MAG: hypothetical protein EU527_13420 [Candidatus Thorarchaeota archaeon]